MHSLLASPPVRPLIGIVCCVLACAPAAGTEETQLDRARAWAIEAVTGALQGAREPIETWRVEETGGEWAAVNARDGRRLPLPTDAGAPRLVGVLSSAPAAAPNLRWLVYYAGSPGTKVPVHHFRAVLFDVRSGRVYGHPLLSAVHAGAERADGMAEVSWDEPRRVLRIRAAGDEDELELRL
jgi:hypothetical protein